MRPGRWWAQCIGERGRDPAWTRIGREARRSAPFISPGSPRRRHRDEPREGISSMKVRGVPQEALRGCRGWRSPPCSRRRASARSQARPAQPKSRSSRRANCRRRRRSTSTTSTRSRPPSKRTKHGAWVLIEPGVYDEEVKIRKPHSDIFIRGMDRNARDHRRPEQIDPGGRNGIEAYKANKIWIENLTVAQLRT